MKTLKTLAFIKLRKETEFHTQEGIKILIERKKTLELNLTQVCIYAKQKGNEILIAEKRNCPTEVEFIVEGGDVAKIIIDEKGRNAIFKIN